MLFALTGASGQLGRLVVQELLDTGTSAEQVVAIVRDPAKIADLAARGVVVRQAEYGDPAALRDALDGIDRLLLISISGAGASSAHRNVIEAAHTAGVGHIAYTSILNADTSSNPLAPEHAATEQILAESGIPSTILRNAWYHEFYTRLLPGYLAAGEVTGASGQGRISGAARADFAAAAATILTAGSTESRTYELGGPSFTLAELTDTINAVAGTSLAYRDLTQAEYAAELQQSGLDPDSARMFAASDASIAHGEMHADSDDLSRLVGRELRPLADTLRQAL
ncbi:SDR family oxidoreductase [Streptomyces xiamenensis]|uniref:SDR family oxidoreductase n=1 Tax=Streptomyces xiamenensis TaxID=408015 RepID=UPI0036E7E693